MFPEFIFLYSLYSLLVFKTCIDTFLIMLFYLLKEISRYKEIWSPVSRCHKRGGLWLIIYSYTYLCIQYLKPVDWFNVRIHLFLSCRLSLWLCLTIVVEHISLPLLKPLISIWVIDSFISELTSSTDCMSCMIFLYLWWNFNTGLRGSEDGYRFDSKTDRCTCHGTYSQLLGVCVESQTDTNRLNYL